MGSTLTANICSLFLTLFLVSTSQGVDICNRRDMTSFSGEIKSPGFPNNYPPRKDCSLNIKVPSGYSIIISFKAMDLESADDEDACYDMLYVEDVIMQKRMMHCGKQLPKDFTSQSHHVRIRFKSDGSDVGTKPAGFRLTYRAVRNLRATSVCPGQEFIAKPEGGYLRSPNYPLNYYNNLNCKFTLRVPFGKKTHVEFVELVVEPRQGCLLDRLNITSGTVNDRKSIQYCGGGGTKFPTLVFKGNKVYFHFVTNNRVTQKGFLLKYYFTDDKSYTNDCVCSTGKPYIVVDLQLKKLNRDTDDIHFDFKTTQANGVILYAMGRHPDFIEVRLVQGQIKVSVDLGTGKGSIVVPSAGLNDNRWHTVEVKRIAKRVDVKVKGNIDYEGIFWTKGVFTKLDLRPPNAALFVAGTNSRRRGPNFIGCLRNFVIDKTTPIIHALQGVSAHNIYHDKFLRCSGN